jgi:hemerythrin
MTRHKTDARPLPEGLKVVEAHHERLRETLTEIESTRDLGQLMKLLDQLPSFLMKHFALEESPEGLYDQIGIRGAEHLPDIQRLVEQHQHLIEQVRNLLTRARSVVEGPVAELFREAASISALLAEHEARESELIDEVLAKSPAT